MSRSFSRAASAHSAGLAIDGAISRLVRDLTSPPPPPEEEYTRALEKFREAREATLAIIRELTQMQADFFPATGRWSIGQNVEHLLLTEKLYRAQMQKLIELARKGGKQNLQLTFDELDNSIALIPRDAISKLVVPLNVLNLFIPRAVRKAMIRTPLIPALNPSASNPSASQPIAELRSRAASSLHATEEIFRGKLPPDLLQTTLSHPLLGTNNVVEILGILAAHEERHHGQIRAVRANRHFPPDGFPRNESKSGVQRAEEALSTGTRQSVQKVKTSGIPGP
jgi:hypothetical protein